MNIITDNIHKIASLCHKYKVNKMYAFGSVLTNRFNANSDVDILVDFSKDITYHTYADNFFGLHDDLRSLFGRDVDLVDETTVKNRFFKEELDETKYLIYG